MRAESTDRSVGSTSRRPSDRLRWARGRARSGRFPQTARLDSHRSILAIALSIKACQEGFRVAFATAQQWVTRLEAAQERNSLDEELRRLERYHVLVVDEVGYLPLERQAANLLFALIARRYERGSIILTSNKAFSEWGAITGDEVLATAILDRLLHHCDVLSINGPSYRLKDRFLTPPEPPMP